MELKWILLLVVLTFSDTFGIPGDPVMFFPPLEVRTMDSSSRPVSFPFSSAQFQPMGQSMVMQPQLIPDFQDPDDQEPMPSELSPMRVQHNIFHKSFASTQPSQPQTEFIAEPPHDSKPHNFTLNQFVEALNGISDHVGGDQKPEPPRSAEDEYASPSSSYGSYLPYPRPYSRPYGYGYSYPQYRPPASGHYGYHVEPPAYPVYQKPAYSPAVYHPAAKTLKPLSGLFEPVATKAASKVSGLLSLVLSLLGSGSGGGGLTGFKDILINGIVKPLLIAKGGIKSLISKLTIPVISLLLINLEVLITVWWLWEDCPEPKVQHAPVYHYPKPAYGRPY